MIAQTCVTLAACIFTVSHKLVSKTVVLSDVVKIDCQPVEPFCSAIVRIAVSLIYFAEFTVIRVYR